MSAVLGLACLIIAAILFLVSTAMWAYHRGHTDGQHKGYEEGFADARKFSELWWVTSEKQIEEAREQIWREEPKEGQWP